MQNKLAKQRRGITLLFVVSMIVLFLLMGTTFVIVSNDYLRASKKRALRDIFSIDRTALVERAMLDVIRGPALDNTTSPLRGHDLLSDMYGYGLKGAVVETIPGDTDLTNAPQVAGVPQTRNWVSARPSGNQLLQIRLKSNTTALSLGSAVRDEVIDLRTGLQEALSNESGFYNGHILTFISGPIQGVSTRIIDYVPADAIDASGVGFRFIIDASPWSNFASGITPALLGSSEVVINRLPFSGLGAGGFNVAATEDTAALSPLALLPNRVGIPRIDPRFLADPTFTPRVDLTNSDISQGALGYLANNPAESYDAIDIQNMYLAGLGQPSFHRDALVAHHGDALAASRHTFSAFDPMPGDSAPALVVDSDNDGIPDAFWMDTGYPIQSNGNGRFYKPLVAYRVIDLDGRLNLNVVGNRADAEFVRTGGTPINYAGQGYGPAEISPADLLGINDYEFLLQGTANLPGRYGFGPDGIGGTDDEFAGNPDTTTRDFWSEQKLFGYPTGMNVVGGLFASSPVDIRGRFGVQGPAGPLFVDLNSPGFNNSLPQVDFVTTYNGTFDSMVNTPYESNFAPSPFFRWNTGDDDAPFAASELERVLRQADIDSNLLDDRLYSLISSSVTTPATRNSVTTDSFEVPVAPHMTVTAAGLSNSLINVLREKIRVELGIPAATPLAPADAALIDNVVQFGRTTIPAATERGFSLLAPEVALGLKLNINRPLGDGVDNNGNGVVDEEGEINGLDLDNNMVVDFADENGTIPETARADLARHLYILTLLTCEEELDTSVMSRIEFVDAVAQWAINVVDFRDPDAINTPFEYDPNPWDGWNPDGVVTAGETNNAGRRLVWGLERPELLITETFATHDRRNQDTAVAMDVAGGDLDYDSRLVPQASAFFELYMPWTQDSNNQVLAPELSSTGAGIDLQRLAPNNSPVWRMGVKRLRDDTTLLRSVYFADLSAATPPADGGEAFFTTLTLPELQPGKFAVVGPSGNDRSVPNGEFRTTFGRRNGAVEGTGTSLLLDSTRSITLIPTADETDEQIVRNEWNGTAMAEIRRQGIAVVIDGVPTSATTAPRNFCISDPVGGYPLPAALDVVDGYAFTTPSNEPVDERFGADVDKPALWNNGTTDRFRFVELQRLANPLLAWDVDTNPYIAIDVMPVDLLAFNGVVANSDNSPIPNERSAMAPVLNPAPAGDTDPGSLERGENQTQNRLLFATDLGDDSSAATANAVADGHNFSFVIDETFGEVNFDYLNNGGAGGVDRFSWLTWNNRPYISQYELMNVPFSSPGELTSHFTVRDSTFNPYTDDPTTLTPTRQGVRQLGSTFGHLLNFHGHDDSTSPERANFYRLLDYTEVPSRYVGTEKWLNASVFTNSPFNSISHFRYPGKINLNTIPGDEVFDALLGDYTSELSYTSFNGSRWQTGGSRFNRPYRNSHEGNLVPPGVPVMENVDCGLFRRATPGSDESIFDFNLNDVTRDTERSGYFKNALRQRLGNMVTTRSSVFAIWVTVGYFEVNEDGTLRLDPTGQGIEVGAETGEIVRNRGFCIFDRSVPMGFEPGKNHNVERGILVKSIIE